MTIEEMREKKREMGLTNQHIALLSGVPLGTVQKILSGETKAPRRDTIRALEKVFLIRMDHGYAYSFGKEREEEMIAERKAIYDAKAPGQYTIDDYYALPDDRRVELIDGVFYDMPAPTVLHQKVIGELCLQFAACAENHPGCEVILSPCDVQLNMDKRTMVQPDLFVSCHNFDRKRHAYPGAPELVVEVLSPSNRPYDMHLKAWKYQQAGVREYWTVDPQNRMVTVWHFEKSEPMPTICGFDTVIPIGISDGKCSVDLRRIAEKLREYL